MDAGGSATPGAVAEGWPACGFSPTCRPGRSWASRQLGNCSCITLPPRRLFQTPFYLLHPWSRAPMQSCVLRCSRPPLPARLYLLHPYSRTSRHPWRSLPSRHSYSLGNCSLHCSRPLLPARLYLLHPWSRTFRHPWRRIHQGRPTTESNPVSVIVKHYTSATDYCPPLKPSCRYWLDFGLVQHHVNHGLSRSGGHRPLSILWPGICS
jgi:hypothetical protein